MSKVGHRHALLIGIGRYPGLPEHQQLYGPVNDVLAMADLLKKQFDFPKSGIKILCDEAATRHNILAELERLIENVSHDDRVVIHFSGHGSQVENQKGDEPDGLDETLVPYDATRDPTKPTRDVRDDELRSILARLDDKGAFVTLVLDCCHAGHVHRKSIRFRGIEPARGTDVDTQADKAAKSSRLHWIHRGSRQVVLAACHDHQLAAERWVNEDTAHGDWSFALLEVLRKARAGATAREVFEEASLLLATKNRDQWPLIEGARDRTIFGSQLQRPARYVLVQKRTDEMIELAAGASHGIVKGSKWRLLDSSIEEDVPRMLGLAEVSRVRALSSQARLLEIGVSSDRIKPGVRAVEDQVTYGDFRLPVICPPGLSADLARRINNSPILHLVEAGSGRLVSSPDPVVLSDEQTLIENSFLLKHLEDKARFRHGLSLTNKDPKSHLTDTFNLKLLRKESQNWVAAESDASGAIGYREGDAFALEMSHEADCGLFVYLLDFGFSGRVTQLVPREGGSEFLYPDLPLRIGTSPSDELRLWFPEPCQDPHPTGFLKIFATTKPVDLTWLCTDHPWPVHRQASTRLECLLAMRAPKPTYRCEEDWTTCTRAFRVQRKLS